MTKPIGGFFEMACGTSSQYHDGAIALNSARNALRYVIRAYNIREMYVPYYTCPVVWDAIMSEGCNIIPYDIDDTFVPNCDFPDNAFILYNNYFGVCGKIVLELSKKYKNLIIDNAQAFFAPHHALATIYSPRKFFGLPDGGLLYSDKKLDSEFETAVSYDLCSHLLKRIDLGPNAAYDEFKRNDSVLENRPIQKMSRLTKSLMGNLDYDFARHRRLENFRTLHNALGYLNKIKIDLSDDDVPMVYPFCTNDATLRARLIENQIFVAKYWPVETGTGCMMGDYAQTMASTIVPLPIDHRYDTNDMERVIGIIQDESKAATFG